MNQLPERHVPVPRDVGAAGPVMRRVERLIDRTVPLLVILAVLAVVVGGVFAVLSLAADQPAACETQTTPAGQSVCVRK